MPPGAGAQCFSFALSQATVVPVHALPRASALTALPPQLLYVDTEGFESTGRANSYDDRIFAVSAVVSSLLVYNLPETIRGSDVSKLSFAVDLAQGFYDTVEVRSWACHLGLPGGSSDGELHPFAGLAGRQQHGWS